MKSYDEKLYDHFVELSAKFDELKIEVTSLRKENKQLKKQVEKLTIKNEKNEIIIKELKAENKVLKLENQKLKNENEKLKLQVGKLQSIINKDSSNSSKPSSTNGYKKVVTNRREKSNKSKGGQQGHFFSTLDEKVIEKLIKQGAKYEIKEINKNESNKNCEYIVEKIIDIEFKTIIKEYRYYPDINGNYGIKKNNIINVSYGNKLKSFATSLMYQFPNSTDAVKEIIFSITNNAINVSKGTLINWSSKLSGNLEKELVNIENNLLASYYINQDESNIKINGKHSNVICSSNKTHTRFWISDKKTIKVLEEIGFLSKYNGIIVQDATSIYRPFVENISQCLSHILRYLKGIYENVRHRQPKILSQFLTETIEEREKKIKEGIIGYTKEEYIEKVKIYNNIINKWDEEWKADRKNPVYEEERKLLSRLKENHKNEVLYFLKDFKIPATNNQAEADQRPIKIKQKIGKFRSYNGASRYAIIRSCVNTYKKNDINILKAFECAFENKTIIV